MVTYIFQIFCQKSLLRTLAHLIPQLSCQKPLIENMFFKTTQKIIYSPFLLLSGNFLVIPVCFDLKFCRVIKTWNEKSLMNSQKRQNNFYRFQIIFTFWGYDTCICYNEIFWVIFYIYNASIILPKFEIYKTLFDFCGIDYTLSITLPSPRLQCYMITLYYQFLPLWEIFEGNLRQ